MQRKYVLGIAAISAAAAMAIAWLIMPGQYAGDIYVRASTLIISANLAVAVVLMVVYVFIYKEVPSKFTLTLLLVMVTLVLYSATSNPLLHAACGFWHANTNYLTILPDIFAAVALWALAYVSLE
ncbi:MAG: hypothetical protein HZB92_09470 [Euryarchaeota archaeon]|nr:hypothetical protein [Euryarchaeota archaeon]